jgi:uncharacterized protein
MHRRLSWSVPALALTLALALAHPAAAQTPSQVAAADELFKSMKLETQVLNTSAAMIETEVGRTAGMQAYRDVMLNWLRKYMTWEAMKPELIKLYTETYTEAELKELAVFYKTPVGQKSLTKMPELMQKTAMIGAKLGQPHVDELKTLMDARRDELQKQQEKAAAATAAKTPGTQIPPAAKKPTAEPRKP